MKNIQIIDGAMNCVYDIFSATEEEFETIFPFDTNIAFIDEVYLSDDEAKLDELFNNIWRRPVPKSQAQGIHGILFYELEEKKIYYPNRRDEDAVNPDGTPLR
ncbi:hypothetical protein [Pseudomonas fluorescens]|uniref:Uncharacterized protein n=1 Tax=Pseudomonas fluorescens TaxID=294 RepID=A0A5E7RAP6_PSEFL|nr:hypothetical protein [Pseudomonas fluorescens]VVO28190.1 hypothetical protein PS833_04778 [Pseudomonas fluorescens]VVP70825.1 hypothetical protein PS914_01083 [Pseudomonas fluorescens]